MRIFIALLFNRQAKDNFFNFIEKLKANYPGNYTTYNNLHLTLYYIGEIDETMVETVIDSIKRIDYSQFSYQTIGLGSFKNTNKHKLVHLQIEENQELHDLHRLIISVLRKAGIKIDNANFTPHITFGRKVEISDHEFSEMEFSNLVLVANRISIMESKRVNGELVYQELDYQFLKK